MAQTITAGIDVGSHHVKVVICELGKNKDKIQPKIIGTGYAESKGLRHGYIIGHGDAVKSIRQAVRQAERAANTEVKKAFLSVGGVGLTGTISQASVMVSRGDSEINELDVNKTNEACENELPSSFLQNREIIHTVPISYKIDGRPVLGRPQGMKGMKLEARTLFVTSLKQHLDDLVQAVGDAGVEVEDVMAAPIAASFVALTKTQKIAGCVLAQVGAETVSIVIFENNIPISLEVFPIGSLDITHDIALGLKITLEEAERIKIGMEPGGNYSKKKLDEVVHARLADIFELIEGHLKRIGRSGLLPAGIILTGGGAGLEGIADIARAHLKLPAKVSGLSFSGDTHGLGAEAWSVAYGLGILGLSQSEEPALGIKLVSRTKSNILAWIRQFLP